MSALIRSSLIIFFLVSCQSSETLKTASVKTEAAYFSPQEVVAGMNVLVAIIDWPQETIEYQKNILVTPETAKSLILPLHPLWDEKIEEVALQMPEWDKSKTLNIVNDCSKRCDCEFYQTVLDRHPEILEKGNQELKNFVGQKIQKNKSDVLNCLNNIPPIQNLLTFLEKEKKNYEATGI